MMCWKKCSSQELGRSAKLRGSLEAMMLGAEAADSLQTRSRVHVMQEQTSDIAE